MNDRIHTQLPETAAMPVLCRRPGPARLHTAARPTRGRVLLCIAALWTGIAIAADGTTRMQAVADGYEHDAFFAVDFAGDRGLAVGDHGAIHETLDGGERWQAVTDVPTTVALLGVAVSTRGDIAVGQAGTILSRPAGGSWTAAESGTTERLFAVSRNARGQAVAVGAFGVTLLSADAGASWRAAMPQWDRYVDPGVQPHLYAAHVGDDGTVTVAGEFGLILRSDDDGKTWRSLHRGEASVFGLDLRADGVGYAVGQSGIALRTDDGGEQWTAVDSGTGAHLFAVDSSPQGRVLATGMRELVVGQAQAGRWRLAPSADDAWYADVALPADGDTAVAVGQSGRIIRIGR